MTLDSAGFRNKWGEHRSGFFFSPVRRELAFARTEFTPQNVREIKPWIIVHLLSLVIFWSPQEVLLYSVNRLLAFPGMACMITNLTRWCTPDWNLSKSRDENFSVGIVRQEGILAHVNIRICTWTGLH